MDWCSMFMDWKKILLKCPYYPNYEKIQCNSYQNYNVFFHRNGKINPKMYMEPKRCWIAKAVLRKNKAGGITCPDFKVYQKAIIMTTVGISIKKRHKGPVKYKREPRHKPINIWSINLQQRSQEYTRGKR